MKKITFALAFLSATVGGYSQNNNNTVIPPAIIEQSKFSFGVQGGYGHSFIAPYNNYRFNSSWNAGISALYAPGTHWGFGLDALYSHEGATFQSNDINRTVTLDYVRIPIKAVYFFNTYQKDFRPKVSIGPTLGFLTHQNNSVDAASFDFGANVSAGFNYRLARAIWLTVDATYYQGFLDIYTKNPYHDLNGNIRLNVGLSFGF